MAQKEIKNWLDTTLVEISNNLIEMANTIKSSSYDDTEIKQNINKLLTFMDKIMKYIRVTIVYDTNRNLSTLPFDNENALIVLTRDEIDWIKRTTILFDITQNYIKIDGVHAPLDLIKTLIANIVSLPYENQQLLLNIIGNSDKITKLNELLK